MQRDTEIERELLNCKYTERMRQYVRKLIRSAKISELKNLRQISTKVIKCNLGKPSDKRQPK
jgi:hypothetical protein